MIKRLVKGQEESLDIIIPVVDRPGLGKTILARNIYNDPKLSYEFVSILWVNVGMEYKIKDIYLRILKFFTKRIEDHLNDDEDTLANVISSFISNRGRCLIILDDVWEAQVIDYVMKVFPENKKGHRIVMTTREGYVAAYANPEPHNLKFLTPKESFELLVRSVFGMGSCPDKLKEVGEKIAVHCGGVPLNLMVIAGALRGRSTTNDWQIVERSVAQHLYSNYNRDSGVFVEMSYDRLPQQVQTCFLYCGIFPRDFDIPAWKLIRMWIAEGLIKPQLSYTLEEITKHHLNDLVNITTQTSLT
ncbi:hypothetical protein KY289_019473 [Solanum tuberosum]|nr:hypothetical protein KY289_019473 [Solanum tuberosum]